MFDIQAALVRDVFLGNVKLPDDDNETKTSRRYFSNGKNVRRLIPVENHEAFSDLQTDYIR